MRCHTPPGCIINPNDPTASTYLPAGTVVPLIPIFRAQEASASPWSGTVPGWNWAAALATPFWAARHRAGGLAALSSLVSILTILLSFASILVARQPKLSGTTTGFLVVSFLFFWLPTALYAGQCGNTLAWRSGRYSNKEILVKAQRKWSVWAIIGFNLVIILLALSLAGLRRG